jgi:hypothetical protein
MIQVTVFDVFYVTWKYRAFRARSVGIVSGVKKCLESITSRWGSRNSVAEDSSLLGYYAVSYPTRLESLEEFLSDWWTGPARVDLCLYNLWSKFIHINLHSYKRTNVFFCTCEDFLIIIVHLFTISICCYKSGIILHIFSTKHTDLQLGVAGLKSWLGQWLSWGFCGFPQSLQVNARIAPFNFTEHDNFVTTFSSR